MLEFHSFCSLDQKVDQLDLSAIAFKIQYEKRWSIEKINHVIEQYKLWLKMVARHPDESIIPTKEVDEVWHMHILDTRAYMVDCNKIFGHYLHHFPYFGMRGSEDNTDLHDAFAASQGAMLAEFGECLRLFEEQVAEGALCGPENCDPSIFSDTRRPRLASTGEYFVA